MVPWSHRPMSWWTSRNTRAGRSRFAVSSDGLFSWYTYCIDYNCQAAQGYRREVIKDCEAEGGTDCVIFAVGDEVQVEYRVGDPATMVAAKSAPCAIDTFMANAAANSIVASLRAGACGSFRRFGYLDDFKAFAANVAKAAQASRPKDVEALLALKIDGGTVDEVRRALIAKIGENIGVRRFALLEAPAVVGVYLHGSRIGALVAMKSGDDAVAKDIAMHVAAINPASLAAADVPADQVAKEKEIQAEQTRNDPKLAGKPPEMIGKIVEGKIRKWLNEVTLLGQPFVKDDKQSVEQYLKQAHGEVAAFIRYEVGAGIEKKQEDFAAEVAKTVRDAGTPPPQGAAAK